MTREELGGPSGTKDVDSCSREVECRLAALQLVYPNKSFRLLLNSTGSDGLIFIEEGNDGVVYKVNQGWRLIYGEAEARILYLMAQEGIAPAFFDYVPADPKQDTYYARYPETEDRDKDKLKLLEKYEYGDDFVVRREFQDRGLEHGILAMGRVFFEQEVSIGLEHKVQEMFRLAQGMHKLKFLPADTEIQFDRMTNRYLFLDCGGIRVVEEIKMKDLLGMLLWIADNIASNSVEKNRLEKEAFGLVQDLMRV